MNLADVIALGHRTIDSQRHGNPVAIAEDRRHFKTNAGGLGGFFAGEALDEFVFLVRGLKSIGSAKARTNG